MSIDTNNMSVDEIRELQSKLAQQLDQKLNADRNAMIEEFVSKIEQNGYDIKETLDVLQNILAKKTAKYCHPENNNLFWSGKGPLPQWLREEIDRGRDKSEFLSR